MEQAEEWTLQACWLTAQASQGAGKVHKLIQRSSLFFEGNGIWYDFMVYTDHQSAKPIWVGFSAKGDHHSWRQCSQHGLQFDSGGGSSHTCPLHWSASGDKQTMHAIILTDSMSLLQKLKRAGMKGNDWADRLAGKAAIRNGMRLRSEVLRCLRQYLRVHGQPAIDHWKKRY